MAAATSSGDSIPRFLGADEERETIVLASYPRSGNSLIRGLLEKLTLFVTGSDTKPDRTLSKSLSNFGLQGEGVVDSRAWIVKTHYPERFGWKKFTSHRAIVLVRNPFDAIDSYFNMCLTNSHTGSLDESQYERFRDKWTGMTGNEIQIWANFYQYWLRRMVPLMVVRYEDLILNRREVLTRLLCWMLRVDSIEGTVYAERMDQLCSDEVQADKVGPYKPRRGKIGSSFVHYSDAQREQILQLAPRELMCFGYHPKQGFPDAVVLPVRSRCVNKVEDGAAVGKRPRSMRVNGDVEAALRSADDQFGRAMSTYRRQLTDAICLEGGVLVDGEGKPVVAAPADSSGGGAEVAVAGVGDEGGTEDRKTSAEDQQQLLLEEEAEQQEEEARVGMAGPDVGSPQITQ